jgi:hypothetical protein
MGMPLFARPKSGAKMTRLRGVRASVSAIPALPDIARRTEMERYARNLNDFCINDCFIKKWF